MEKVKQILEFKLIDAGGFQVDVYNIVFLFLLFFFTKLILVFVNKFLTNKSKGSKLDPGRAHSVYSIIKYFVVVIAVVIGLESIGVKTTIIVASSAALLVGIGLGIQQIFFDVVSGFIILFGGVVRVGDIIEVDKIVGEVADVGFRVTKIVTRDEINMIIPNSKFVGDNVTNWSYDNHLTRFHLYVGVAYGSDVEKVKSVLLESAKESTHVNHEKPPIVRFMDFGDSSLDFELLFWSENIFRIDDVYSELRFTINRKFIERGVTIPFPQMDVHMKEKN